ncbi:ATP-dependent zinc metalloprotease FtsH [Christensenellaceae bacterium OttesenSCG-928-K19]|nr:ATP-dependent zinc metalloprotease FtsH [Christensenellaceae bacterium OttesenSCG-928-K19]
MGKFLRGPFIYIIIIVIIIIATQFLSTPQQTAIDELDYESFLQKVENKEIKDLVIIDRTIYGRYNDSEITDEQFPDQHDFTAVIPPSIEQFNRDMQAVIGTDNPLEYGYSLNYQPTPEANFFLQLLPYLIPMVLLLVLWVIIMRRSQGAGGGTGGAMTFGKSKARMTDGGDTKKTFADVAGADEEKEELVEIVQFLKHPERFKELGARIPKGVLLVGPPGGGKTLLAKAVAGEARVPFFSISGSDFVEMFVGVGASRVRDLFENAKKNAPCIVFIDEIDAVGRQRGAGLGGGHDEREQTLNQLLVEMDGFEVNEGIIVMAATNRKDILDPALLRAGRFDRQITVHYPDVKGREEILNVHSKGKPFESGVDMKTIARRTPGFIGADLENVLNEAAILAARRKKKKIGMSEIEEAITRVIAGPEKKSRLVTEEDKRTTAYHEVGHAILADKLPKCDPVHEVSIIPRGQAAGYTMTLPEKDDQHVFKSKLTDEITMMLGGRVAETLTIKDVSTGAISDLQRATSIAKDMVMKYGMSDEIGPMFLGGAHEVFLGREFGQQQEFSDETAARVDQESKKILVACYENAEKILKTNLKKLLDIGEVLMRKEKLSGEEFKKLLDSDGDLDVNNIDIGDTSFLDDNNGDADEPIKAPSEDGNGPENNLYDEGYQPPDSRGLYGRGRNGDEDK